MVGLEIRRALTVLALVVAWACGAQESTPSVLSDGGMSTPGYVGVSGGLLLPGNGNSLERAGEVSARVGLYTSDFLAWELEGVCAPNASSRGGHGHLSGVAARGLYHLSGIEEFDRLFGCERFDPFVTFGGCARFGARHAFADGSHRTAIGLAVGVGAFYHLTENLDLRFDAQAMLGCDSPCGMLYSAAIGLQWNFGGGGE